MAHRSGRCWPTCGPLGQIHDSFIIAAGRDGLWIIDQHVAHERILFEQVLKQQAEGGVETAAVVDADGAGADARRSRSSTPGLRRNWSAPGSTTEPFGNRTIAVKAAPAGIGPADIEKLLFEILETRGARTTQGVARRSAARDGRLDRLPRRDQDQHAAGSEQRWNGCLQGAGCNGLPDELPAWPAHRTALFHARYSQELPPHLKQCVTHTKLKL